MKLFNLKKSLNWEEKASVLSRRLYYFEICLLIISSVGTLFLSFEIFSDSSFFKRTLILLCGTFCISSYHFLFQCLWDLWAELHDRMSSSKRDSTLLHIEKPVLTIKSSIKIVLSNESAVFRKENASYLQSKISMLVGVTCEVIEVEKAEAMLKYVTDHVVHLVILDSHYHNQSSLKWAEKIKNVDKNIPVIVCSKESKQESPFIDAWFSHLKRDSDIEQLLPYFLDKETISGT